MLSNWCLYPGQSEPFHSSFPSASLGHRLSGVSWQIYLMKALLLRWLGVASAKRMSDFVKCLNIIYQWKTKVVGLFMPGDLNHVNIVSVWTIDNLAWAQLLWDDNKWIQILFIHFCDHTLWYENADCVSLVCETKTISKIQRLWPWSLKRWTATISLKLKIKTGRTPNNNNWNM